MAVRIFIYRSDFCGSGLGVLMMTTSASSSAVLHNQLLEACGKIIALDNYVRL